MPHIDQSANRIALTNEEHDALLTLVACGVYRKNYLTGKNLGDLTIRNRICDAMETVIKILDDCPIERKAEIVNEKN